VDDVAPASGAVVEVDSAVSDDTSSEMPALSLVGADDSVGCADVDGSELTMVVCGEPSVAAGSLVRVTDDEHAAVTAMIDARDDMRKIRFMSLSLRKFSPV
jgi:hypothetical protein